MSELSCKKSSAELPAFTQLVSAVDKATGKSQEVKITAGSGLSEDEIEKMVKDAELHAEEDKKFQLIIKSG